MNLVVLAPIQGYQWALKQWPCNPIVSIQPSNREGSYLIGHLVEGVVGRRGHEDEDEDDDVQPQVERLIHFSVAVTGTDEKMD